MKTILFILLLLYPITGNQNIPFEPQSNIIITADLITIKSVFPTWTHVSHIELKKGLNAGYYVLYSDEKNGQSIEYKIVNY